MPPISPLQEFAAQHDTLIFFRTEDFDLSDYSGKSVNQKAFRLTSQIGSNILLGRSQPFYKFRINPQQLNVDKAKVQSKVLTKKGWELHYHNENLITRSYNGTTGYLQSELLSLGINDIKISPAWIKLKALDAFYEESIQNLKMYFLSEIHTGHFDSFNFVQDSEDPWQINYSFSFSSFAGESITLTEASRLSSIPFGSQIVGSVGTLINL